MQALFSMDSSLDFSLERLDHFKSNFACSKKSLSFFMELTEGIIEKKERLDEIIDHFSKNWKLSRMTQVDRNILRLGVYELLFRKSIPSKVTINEAIEIGKKFGTDDSGAFINGILDSVRIAIKNKEL